MQPVKTNESTAARRVMVFPLVVDATDGLTPETGEAAGQPQYSVDGGANWVNTGATLTGGTNGSYQVQLAQGEVNQAVGTAILGRYKSANTAEARAVPILIVAYDPYDSVRQGMTALPNAAADGAGGLPISDAGGLDLDTLLGRLDAAISSRHASGAAVASVSGAVGSMADAGASLTALGDTRIANLDAAITSRAAGAKLLDYIQLLARSDAAIATDNSVALGEINTNEGSGAGDYSNQTEAQEALRDRGDAAWVTATGFSTHSAADVWSVGTRTLTSFGTLVADIWAALTSGLTAVGSIGKLLVDNLNATVGSRSSHSAADAGSAAATAILVTPAQKVVTDANGYVAADAKLVEGADATDQINAAVDEALNTAIPASPTAHSINERVKALDDLLQAGGDGDAAAIKTKADLIPASGIATVDNQTTILARLGSITGTGVNTVLGFFKALLSKAATLPSDIGGTFNPASHSTEAIRERGDVAWTTGGATGTKTVNFTVTDGVAPLQGATIAVRASAGGANLRPGLVTETDGTASTSLDSATYYVQATLNGYSHAEEAVVVETDPQAVSIEMTAFSPGAAAAGLRRVWMRTWDAGGNYVTGRPAFTVTLDVPCKYTDGRVAQVTIRSTDYADHSYAYADLIPTDALTPVDASDTVKYRVLISATGEDKTFTLATGDLSSVELTTLTD